MELSLRTTLDAQVEGDGAVVIPGKPLVDLARLLPESEVTLEYRPEEGTVADRLGLVQLAPPRLQRRGLPAPAGRRRPAARDRPRRAARDDRPRRPLRLARRVAAGADGDPRPLRGRQARDGRDRLLPALRQGDAARRGRARSSRRSFRPGRSRSSRGSRRRRHGRARRAREPRRLRDRRRLADDAPDRRPVPELPAAAARDLRGRADAAEGGARRRRPPRLACSRSATRRSGCACGRRADGLGADAGRGRDAGVAAGRLLRRGVRDRLQRRVPARRSRLDRGRRRAA